MLSGKQIALVVNHTSRIGDTHLVDSLLAIGIQIKHIFASEHGFRGDAGAGETIHNSIDTKTGLPIISLYGDNKKPSAAQLDSVELVIFDIQDVAAGMAEKFFTSESFFNKLAGNDELLAQIKAGKTEAEIRQSWQEDLATYKALRKKYLLYEDFE